MKRHLPICDSIRNIIRLRGVFKFLIVSGFLLQATFSLTYGADKQPGTRVLKGEVYNLNGETLIGVNVIIKGTSNGTITDVDGKFSLRIPKDSVTIIFTYIGMLSEEIQITDQSKLSVTLIEDITMLEETVVIAYGTKKKRDIIGSVSKVESENFRNIATTNYREALQGAAAGVQVTTNNGLPGAFTQVKIRGINSVSSGTDPLWVVDGIPGGGENMVHPNDIKSVEILKDAAATAVYGAAGSNGVIMVTTKKGTKGKPRISLSYQTGISQFNNIDFVELAQTHTFKQILDTARSNSNWVLGQWEPGQSWSNWDSMEDQTLTATQTESINTDWVDLLTQRGNFHDINFAVTQGADNLTSYASLNYRKDKAGLINNAYERVSARLNMDYTKGILTIGGRMFSEYSDADQARSFDFSSMLPWQPVYSNNNRFGYWNPATGNNHVLNMDPTHVQDNQVGFNFRGNLYGEISIPQIEGLIIKTNLSRGYATTTYTKWQSEAFSPPGASDIRKGSRDVGQFNSKMFNVFLTYDTTIEDHAINVLGGFEQNETEKYDTRVSSLNLASVFPGEIDNANISSASSKLIAETRNRRYFSRAEYKFKNRYLFGASLGIDGDARFAKSYRAATFYSLSGGWVISDEVFFSVPKLTMLKIRGSIGRTGNNNIDPNVSKNAYFLNSGSAKYGSYDHQYLYQLGSRNVTWETTNSNDIGLDFGILNNRISGSIAYYYNKVTDMLLKVPLPASAGIANPGNIGGSGEQTIWTNAGSMYNRGLEFFVRANILKNSSISWEVNVTFATSKNKVLSLDRTLDELKTGGILLTGDYGYTYTRKGLALGTYNLAETAGVDPKTGVYMIKKLDQQHWQATGETRQAGDTLITATRSNRNNNRFIQEGKSAIPTYYGGISNTIKYERFDFTINFTFQGGNYIYNRFHERHSMAGEGNTVIYANTYDDSWKKPGDIAEYPRVTWGAKDNDYDVDGNPTGSFPNYDYPMTKFLEKADFLKLKNIIIGYTLPVAKAKMLKIEQLRIYVSGTNLFTISKFTGLDPEMSYSDIPSTIGTANYGGLIFQGNRYPQSRIYSIGVNVTF